MWDSLPDRNFFSESSAEGASGNGSRISFFGYKWSADYGSAIMFSYAFVRPLYVRIKQGQWIEGISL